MSLRDYKNITVVLCSGSVGGDELVVTYVTDLKEGIRLYEKARAKGSVCKLYGCVDLKRRQDIESYKNQVIKAFNSHVKERGAKSKKFGLEILSTYESILCSLMHAELDCNEKELLYSNAKEKCSFLILDSLIDIYTLVN